MKPPQRILLIRNDRLGDLLMNLPAIGAVRRAFPQAHITLVAHEQWMSLLKDHPDWDDLIPFTQEGKTPGWANTWSWAKRLKPHRFDVAVVFNSSKLFHLACFLAQIPVRVGYRRKWGFLLNRTLEDSKSKRQLHESQYNLELIRLLGISNPPTVLSLPVSPEIRKSVESFLHSQGVDLGKPRVALHPFSSNMAKSWSFAHFQALADALGKSNWEVLWIGQPELGQTVSPETFRSGINLTGKISLEWLPTFLQSCRVLVSNDSGPVHVASAVGTPCLVVAPSSHTAHLERWKPLGEIHQILLSPTPIQVAQRVDAFLRSNTKVS